MNKSYTEKPEGTSDLVYQERIHFLMGREKDQVCALYIDVTENQMLAIESKQKKIIKENIKGENVLEWLKRNIYPELVYEDERSVFEERFRRNVLLKEFEEGKTYMEFQNCYYSFDRMKRMYKVEIDTFKNPNNGHIEACAIWKDCTNRYVDDEIRQILYKKDYIALGIIDIERDEIYLRSHNLKLKEFEAQSLIPYEEAVRIMQKKYIALQDRETFGRCTSIEYLKENLRISGQYSFQVYDVENCVERYSFYWFDKTRKYLMVVIDDMTKELETDPVTGGLNREGFIHKTKKILKKNPEKRFAIIYFNIQRFKAVNDLFGYETGDQLLRTAINTLQTSFLRPHAVARVEADRFSVLVDQKNLDLNRLPELLHRTYLQKEMKIEIYGRCGIYYIPENCKLKISDMCDRAKLAKSTISNHYAQPYAVFNEAMNQDYEQRSMALLQLDDAIEKDDIKVYYQPIYDAWTGQIKGAEALARWESKEKGVILPGQFIPALEESGHITRLDTCIYKKVREFQMERFKSGKKMTEVTMNLSRMDLMNQNMCQMILEDTLSKDLPEGMMNYEVTESAYAAISDEGVKFLAELRKEKVRLLIDDFGSGVSSFSTVRNYEFDIMKLDMGFIRGIGKNKKNNNILIAMIDLAHHLEMKVVAEGVETKEQAEFLKNYGCDFLQGYYFSKPVPQEEFEKMLEQI